MHARLTKSVGFRSAAAGCLAMGAVFAAYCELAAYWKEKEVWRVGKATYNLRTMPYAFMALPESP